MTSADVIHSSGVKAPQRKFDAIASMLPLTGFLAALLFLAAGAAIFLGLAALSIRVWRLRFEGLLGFGWKALLASGSRRSLRGSRWRQGSSAS